MAVGPPGRAGRDEVAEVRAVIEDVGGDEMGVVVLACERAVGRTVQASDGVRSYPMRCAGNLHTSVIELLMRAGASGVLVATCPPRDCWGREGPIWLDERVHRGREAELRETLDRRRLRIVPIAKAEGRRLELELSDFRESLRQLDGVKPDADLELDTVCEPPPAEAVS